MPHAITHLKRWGWTSLIFGAALGLGACSNVKPPTDQMSAAQLAVREARASKAPQLAPLELQLASDKLAKAREAMNEEDYVQARRLAEEAQADAQLAQARAQSATAVQAAQEMQQTVESLRREAQRRGVTPSAGAP